MIPRSAVEHYRAQQRLTATTIEETRREWGRMGSDFDGSWRVIQPRLVALLATAQLAAARSGADYVPKVLAETGQRDDPAGEVNPRALSGVASDGRPLDTLLATAVIRTKQAHEGTVYRDGDATEYRPGLGVSGSLAKGGEWLDMAVATQVSDASRAAAGVGIAIRPAVTGYVRMLNEPSCARCAILAGKHYKWNAGFQRHPRCDCRHVPASEDLAGDMTTEPSEYFESLPTAEQLAAEHPNMTVAMRRGAGLYSQEDIFTAKGARAIRDGADMGQVVNARRGMEKAQVYGRDTLITREGITRRGVAGRVRAARGTGATKAPRLMPESIYEVAESRADAIRLLGVHGYIR